MQNTVCRVLQTGPKNRWREDKTTVLCCYCLWRKNITYIVFLGPSDPIFHYSMKIIIIGLPVHM